jgi:hypothetical protein
MLHFGDEAQKSVMLDLCKKVNTPFSLKISILIRSTTLRPEDLEIDPRDYTSAERFKSDYFISSYLSKWKGWRMEKLDPKATAISKFRAAELQCAEANRRLRTFDGLTPELGSVFHAASRKISKILGPFSLDRAMRECKWGPGATFDLRRSSCVSDKICSPLSVTPTALSYLKLQVENDPNWLEAITGIYPSGPLSLLSHRFIEVRGNKLLTVPKNFKTDRVICSEPTGNSFLQQGAGKYIRSRLKRFGVSLDDQTINQDLARRAFMERLATIDLSSASDTISVELVYSLLPVDWALYLDALRSKETLIDGIWYRNHKFSSMGNAYTFELESLIFYALASAVDDLCDSRGVSVFGDDIIIGAEAVELLERTFDYAGFTINRQKSYSEGSFYESCGKHYFCSEDVTPVYQKELVRSPSEVIRAENRLSRFFARPTFFYKDRWKHAIRPTVPWFSRSDDGFLAFDLSRLRYDRNHGFSCHVYVFVPKLKTVNPQAQLAYKLRRPVESSPSSDGRGDLSTVSDTGRWVFRKKYINF